MMEIIAFAVMTTLCVTVAWECVMNGAPEMISELYYRMKHRWVVPLLLMATGMTMAPVMIDKGGVKCMAFFACAGLAFVGAAPAYIERDERSVHKGAAIVAAVAGVAWSASVAAWAVLVAGVMAVLTLGFLYDEDEGWQKMKRHWLLVVEVAGLMCVWMAAFV